MTRTPDRAGRAPSGPAAHGSAPPVADPAGVPSPPFGTPAQTSPAAAPQLPVAGDPSPAGSASASPREASSAVPAGSTGRTYAVILPAGLKMLNLNGRLHWSEERRRAREIRKAAWAVALCDKLPRLGRVSVTAEYQPPDRRHRDGDNIAAAAKHALDGIVAAGCLPGDDRRYVTGTYCTIGEPYPKGRLVLYLTEVAAAPESDGAA